MDRFAQLTGRQYHLFEYDGATDAERMIVMMGSGSETSRATARVLCAAGAQFGVLQVGLYRPFSAADFIAAVPFSVRSIAVLEQTKEPGASGEPLYLDVMSSLGQAVANGERAQMPCVIGGRYWPPMEDMLFTTNLGAMLPGLFFDARFSIRLFLRTSRIHFPTPVLMPGISWCKRKTMSRSRSCFRTGHKAVDPPYRCASHSSLNIFTASPATSDRQTS